MQELFYELLKVALGNAEALPHTPSAKEWTEMYQLAEEQTLLAVCFAALETLDKHGQLVHLSMPLKMQWMGYAMMIEERNKVMDERCVALQKRLSADGFRTYIMKGQGNAALYPPPLSRLRQSGDIDIYLEGGYERVMSYVNMTFPSNEVNVLEIHYHCFSDAEVEIHYKPFVMDGPRNKRLQRFLADEADNCFVNRVSLGEAGTIVVPTLYFNLVYQMVHIHHHLFYEGVGLRQFVDYFFLLQAATADETLDREGVKRIVSDLGLNRFASALTWALGEALGLNRDQMLWSPNERDGRFLLNEVMQMGNFGRSDKNQKGIYTSRWKSFWYVHFKTFRYWRFDHMAWFWSPIMRIKGFLWRKRNGYV